MSAESLFRCVNVGGKSVEEFVWLSVCKMCVNNVSVNGFNVCFDYVVGDRCGGVVWDVCGVHVVVEDGGLA